MSEDDARRIIESWMTGNGGYDRATLAMFGVAWPPRDHWKKALILKMMFGEVEIPEQLVLV